MIKRLALGAAYIILSACGQPQEEAPAGDASYQETLMTQLLDAQPGDLIEIPEGVFAFDRSLSLTVDGVTVRGAGMDKSILSFKNQIAGAEGFLVTASDFTIEDLAIEDTIGDALKITEGENIVIRRVRTEWTGGPKTSNGAYGIYPVQTKNVLMEENVAIAAADAGLYIGQSQNVVVRNNRAEYNVAGIEIENTFDADVYDNIATNNTGGILVFNMPNLKQPGARTRVFDNQVYENNTKNFGHEGTPVASIPAGSGIVVNSNDDVEIFDNVIRDNKTANVIVASLFSTGYSDAETQADFDPYPERIFIRDNVFEGGGNNPDGLDLQALKIALVGPLGSLPDILWDGYVNDALENADPAICVQNGDAQVVNVDGPNGNKNARIADGEHDCALEKLAPVTLTGAAGGMKQGLTALFLLLIASCAQEALQAPTFHASENPERLSGWGMITADDVALRINDGVTPYDLATPLFSDYALKLRTVWTPDSAPAQYRESETFDFPVGTVITKTFYYRHAGDEWENVVTTEPSPAIVEGSMSLDGVRLIETRLLVRREAGWDALPYVWNEEQTDAVLKRAGDVKRLNLMRSVDEIEEFAYLVPNANQCAGCHATDSRTKAIQPIGMKARHLNKPSSFQPAFNQLDHWLATGMLEGDIETPAPQNAVWMDEMLALDDRARAYLDINCSHCHNPNGPADTSGLNLEPDALDAALGVCKPPIAAGGGTGGRRFDIVPGAPDQSITIYRMETTAPAAMMPELGRALAHREGVALVASWIAAMDGRCG